MGITQKQLDNLLPIKKGERRAAKPEHLKKTERIAAKLTKQERRHADQIKMQLGIKKDTDLINYLLTSYKQNEK